MYLMQALTIALKGLRLETTGSGVLFAGIS